MSASSPRRLAPRPLALALAGLERALAPATTLARIQAAWPAAVGELVCAHARPTAERGGVLTVSCTASVWAAELQMMAPQVIDQLNDALGARLVTELHCRTA